MEVDDSADGMVDLSEFVAVGGEPTATEAMELDLVTALDNFELSYLEERHIGMLQSVYQIRRVKPKSSFVGKKSYFCFLDMSSVTPMANILTKTLRMQGCTLKSIP